MEIGELKKYFFHQGEREVGEKTGGDWGDAEKSATVSNFSPLSQIFNWRECIYIEILFEMCNNLVIQESDNGWREGEGGEECCKGPCQESKKGCQVKEQIHEHFLGFFLLSLTYFFLQGSQEKGKDSAQNGIDRGGRDEWEDWDRRKEALVGPKEAWIHQDPRRAGRES